MLQELKTKTEPADVIKIVEETADPDKYKIQRRVADRHLTLMGPRDPPLVIGLLIFLTLMFACLSLIPYQWNYLPLTLLSLIALAGFSSTSERNRIYLDLTEIQEASSTVYLSGVGRDAEIVLSRIVNKLKPSTTEASSD